MSREERDEGFNNSIENVCLQIGALVGVVKELSEAKLYAEESPTLYTVETTDPQEMNRLLKVDDALLALNEIVNDSWQKDMIQGRDADRLINGREEGLSPAEAMQAYRDHIFDVLQQHGIVLDDLL